MVKPLYGTQLLCGSRHKHRRVGKVFYYGNARGVRKKVFELEVYLQKLESGYTLKERKCPIPFGRLYELVAKAAKVCRTWRLLFWSSPLMFGNSRAVEGLGGYFFSLLHFKVRENTKN